MAPGGRGKNRATSGISGRTGTGRYPSTHQLHLYVSPSSAPDASAPAWLLPSASRGLTLVGFTCGFRGRPGARRGMAGMPASPALADLVRTSPRPLLHLRTRQRGGRRRRGVGRGAERAMPRRRGAARARRGPHQRRHLGLGAGPLREGRRRDPGVPPAADVRRARDRRLPLRGRRRGHNARPRPRRRRRRPGAEDRRTPRPAPLLSGRRQAQPLPRGGQHGLQLPGDPGVSWPNDLFVKAGVPERVTLSLVPAARAGHARQPGGRRARSTPSPARSAGATRPPSPAHLEALAADAPDVLPVYRDLGRGHPRTGRRPQ